MQEKEGTACFASWSEKFAWRQKDLVRGEKFFCICICEKAFLLKAGRSSTMTSSVLANAQNFASQKIKQILEAPQDPTSKERKQHEGQIKLHALQSFRLFDKLFLVNQGNGSHANCFIVLYYIIIWFRQNLVW
jgi:hypothetical protein